MKLNVVLTQVLKNLGVDLSDPEAQKLIGNSNLASIEVGDTVTTKLTAEYFTREAAASDPEIRSKIKAETLNGIDAQTKELMTAHEFDAETIADITKEDKSSKKISKMVDKIVELTKAKSKLGGADQTVLNTKIAELNAQILATKTDYETKLLEEQKGRKTDRVNWELDSIYNGLDYSLASDKDISVTAAKAIISNIASKKGLRFETTENGVQILTKEGTEHFEGNIKITPQDFIKKSLMENKMLKVSDGGAATVATAKPNIIQQNKDAKNYQTSTSFDAALDSSLNHFVQK
jgi:hypothetical protein